MNEKIVWETFFLNQRMCTLDLSKFFRHTQRGTIKSPLCYQFTICSFYHNQNIYPLPQICSVFMRVNICRYSCRDFSPPSESYSRETSVFPLLNLHSQKAVKCWMVWHITKQCLLKEPSHIIIIFHRVKRALPYWATIQELHPFYIRPCLLCVHICP